MGIEEIPTLFPTETSPVHKRIVIQYPDGQMEIAGYVDSQPDAFIPPEMNDGVVLCLVVVKPRYYLYRPLMLPEMVGPNGPTGGSFDPRQQ